MVNYGDITGSPEYDIQFWDAVRGKAGNRDVLAKGQVPVMGTYKLPTNALGKLAKAIKKESVFRNMATVQNAYRSTYRIIAKDCKDMATYVEEGAEIPIYDGMEDFTEKGVNSYKLAAFVRVDEDFVRDAAFDIETHVTNRLAYNFAQAEDNSFINGTGVGEPTGILHEKDGAEVGVTTSNLSYDDVIVLFFSVDKKYRKKGVWLMNDKTAQALRTLKDVDGNYLWNHANDTILGKLVVISEFMPDVAEGSKPIVFGDFSYYWVIGRMPVSLRTLTEKFAALFQIGYLAIEFLDGKMIRNEAVKVIQMSKAEN